MRLRISPVLRIALAAVIFALPSTARADIAPPKDYVEQCTIAIQCPDGGGTCEVYHGKTNDDCAKSEANQGREERCHTWGATVGKAVFCPKGSKPPETKASDGKAGKGGCASCAIEAARPSADRAWVGAALGLVVATSLRARARRRSGR